MRTFLEIDPHDLKDNVFQMVGRDWFLLTAGRQDSFNTMTCAWGGLGIAWGTEVATVFVRHNRYTYEFTEREKYFSLSFFEDGHRRALQLCGSTSGRDTDKVAQAGLTPLFDAPAPYFEQARLVLVCRKLYAHDIDTALFHDAVAGAGYQSDALHRVYTGEIVKTLADKDCWGR